jgi:hypothetical protein
MRATVLFVDGAFVHRELRDLKLSVDAIDAPLTSSSPSRYIPRCAHAISMASGALNDSSQMAPSIRVKALNFLQKVASTTTQLICASFGPRTLCPLVDEEVGTKE